MPKMICPVALTPKRLMGNSTIAAMTQLLTKVMIRSAADISVMRLVNMVSPFSRVVKSSIERTIGEGV